MDNKKKANKGLVYAVWSAAIIVSVVAVIFAVIFASCAKDSEQPPETQQVMSVE